MRIRRGIIIQAHNRYNVVANMLVRWVYKRFFVADGNFKADHVRQKDSGSDVWLSEGGGMTARREAYEEFQRNAIVTNAVRNLIYINISIIEKYDRNRLAKTIFGL